ncbi:MAG: hypothetical protein LLG04_01765 [Parachlamydia sp.]|nr:hypothetical protein [Parachlamydia sp.]
MQISLVVPSPLALELHAITPSSEIAERYAIIRQLFARRSWSADPKELLNADGKLNLQVPLQGVWDTLTRLEKVAALFQSRGFKTACALLPSLQQGREEELAQRLSAYQAEVETLTRGVMTAPAIPHYLALRNFLLADATAFTELFQKVSHRLKLDTIDERGSRRVTIKDLQEVLPGNLRILCTIIDSACFSNNLEDLEKVKGPLMICSDIIDNCRQAFEKLRGEVEYKSFFDRMDRAWKCFQIWEKALQDPLHLLPILLFPIQAQNVSSVDFKVENQDQVNLDDAATGWLNDCLIVCQRSTEGVLQDIKKRQGLSKRIETACKQALQSMQEWNQEIGREVHLLREVQLSPEKATQLLQLLDRVQKCSMRLKELEMDYFETLQKQVHGILGDNSFIGRQLFNRPRRLHSLIAHGVVSSLQARAEQMLKVHQLITGFCAPDLQQRSSLFTSMDLLDLQVRESLEQFRIEAVQGLEGEKLRKVEACLSQITTTFSQFIEWMRSEWNQSKPLDFAARSRAFDRVRLFRPLVKRFLAAIKDTAGTTDERPGMQRLSTAVTLLGELVLLDCWPRILDGGSRAKPQMERQTILRLFSCSLREFSRDDLKRICSKWEFPWLANAPQLKKKLQSNSDSIQHLLKELQTNLKQGPGPSLENFEVCTGQWFAKLTKTIARIQQREEGMLQALEEYPELSAHYDEMYEKIRSARQVLERCFFTLNRGLISDLLSRQLIGEEKKDRPAVLVDARIEEYEEEEEELESPVIVPAAVPVTAPSAPKPVENVQTLFKKVSEHCQQLYEQHQGFVLSSKETKRQFLHQFQGDALNNLVHTVLCLRELVMTEAKSPVCVSEIYLRLAVLLEQASKLSLSLKGVAISDSTTSQLLVKSGREGWRWQEHNPLHYCQALEHAGVVSLTSEQTEVIKRLQRVIEVSSRYPYSGGDSHLTDLRHAKAHRLDPQKTRTLLQNGLESCLSILDSVCEQSDERHESSPPYDLDKLAKHLQDFKISETSDDKNLQNEAERLLHTLQQRVKTLHLYRLLPQYREVESLGDGDRSKRQREGTIDTALNNITFILDLSGDILLGKEDPALCMTLASAGLRQQAVLLELAALIQLSQSAHPSARDPSQHYLFNEGDAPMKRYSHDLGQFAEMLHFSRKWQGVCEKLTSYLRSGYRYAGMDSFKWLALLRDRLVQGQLTANESILLNTCLQADDPQNQLDLLNLGIIQMFRVEIKKPLVETLKFVDALLQRYEEQVKNRLNVQIIQIDKMFDEQL